MLKLEDMRNYPIIGQLEQNDLIAIAPFLKENEFASGTVILRQGQVSDELHIVLSGTLDVYLESDRKVSVAKLVKGHFFGEMSCLTGGTVSATVEAEGMVQTLSMPKDGVLQLMDKSTSFRNHMISEMIKRVGDSNDRVEEEYTRSFVVMRQLEQDRQSNYGPLIGSSLFMRNLREQIDKLANEVGPICIVGEKGVGKSRIAFEIHDRSDRSEYPILSFDGASNNVSDWELKVRAAKGGTIIIEQADLLEADLLERLMQSANQTKVIMTVRNVPDVRARIVEVIPIRERVEDIPELVHEFLLKSGAHDPKEAISQEALRMIASYPFLGGNIEELKRVISHAFVLSGGKTIHNTHLRFGMMREPGARPKIGLALGSGSVRGAAHVGVLKVLEQNNIPIDIIAGTSVGAFIGALYAGGQPISAFERVLPTVRWGQLVNFALPPKAFVNNHPMARFVEKYIGPIDFEDLPIPFAAVASDATSGEAYILNKGRVSHAICASTAIPGIMEPVKYKGRLLIDGGVVHPVPVALAKSMGADIVIAVDVSTSPFTKRSPKNFMASILNTIDIMSKKIVQEELQLADIVLNPQLEINQITFKASSAYIQVGEKVTLDALTAIKRTIDAQAVHLQ